MALSSTLFVFLSVLSAAVRPDHELGGEAPAARAPNGLSFGDEVISAAARRIFLPYAAAEPLASWPADDFEKVAQRLDAFDCVTLIDVALAEARCAQLKEPDGPCFLAEIENLRYVDGRAQGYASRLHYFSDWLSHQARRGLVRYLTHLRGSQLLRRDIHFMSDHPEFYPALREGHIYDSIMAREAELSMRLHVVVPRDELVGCRRDLRDGDIAALVGRQDGILVAHVGLVFHDGRNEARFLHASSLPAVGVTTDRTLLEYVEQARWVQAIIFARPLAPLPPLRRPLPTLSEVQPKAF